ncbi:MAG TPA: tripartite tricarboxylate transporter substrate binding protein [Bordetella sp.]|nr:tripartite tricarboxylate transporter substrate binding protein [Bordetella sp.]
MPFIRKLRALAPWALLAALSHAPLAVAQDYPNRPITIIVPFSAGGGVDVMARLLAEKLRDTLKQSIIVENKPGASGMLGAQFVTKAAPDGYTLLLGSAGETAINAYVYKARMLYQPDRDLAPVSLVTRVPNVLVVGPSVKAGDVAGLVAQAKAHPGRLTYATSGVGNPQHLNGALLQSIAGIDMVHVPYKGASGQLADVAGGSVDMTFVSYAAAKAFIDAGKVRPLAVTSAKRASFAPDIPAIAETPALRAYSLENWFGLFAPAHTPEAVLDRINQAVRAALQDPQLAQRLREQGGEPAPMSVAEFKQFIQHESTQYQAIVTQANISAEN